MHPEFIINISDLKIVLSAYSLFAVVAAAVAFALSLILLKKIGWKIWQAAILYFSCAAAFLLGARLLNFAVNHDNYLREGFSVFSLSFGHFSVYGGMMLACIPPIIFARVWRKNFWLLADSMVFAFIAAFAMMRIGCFLNGCCYGKVCDVFWGVRAPDYFVRFHDEVNSMLPSFARSGGEILVYPTQLMEMILALLFIPSGIWLNKKYRGYGTVTGAFIAWFAALRLFVFGFRELPYSDTVLNVIYPALYIACIIGGAILLGYNLRRAKAGENANE
jgi:phosphatidylglycerol:prolipoprotein diacylglycerol transferase